MRIVGFHVDGFGLLHDLDVTGVGPGTTVVLGPNEAGKSTLHAFLAVTLFGYPRRNDADGRRRYEPIAGGHHGGWVEVEDDDGRRWVVHRSPTRSPRLRVVRPDGTEQVGEGALAGLVEDGLDLAQFEQVHAIDLDALTGLGSLAGPALQDLLFDAATVGAGRSLRGARDAAERARDALWTPTATTRPLAAALRARDDARRAVREARAAAAGFVDVRADRDRTAARIAALSDERARLLDERALVTRVVEAWPVRRRLDRAEQQAAASPNEVPSDQPLSVVAREATALRARLADHRADLDRLRRAEGAAREAEASLAAALTEVGAGWDRAAVAAVRTDAASREQLQLAAATLVGARGDHRVAERRRDDRAGAVDRRRAALAGRRERRQTAPPLDQVRAAEEAVAVLRGRVPTIEQAALVPAAGSPTARRVLATAAAVLVLALAATTASDGAGRLAALLVAIVAAMVVGVALGRTGSRRHEPSPLAATVGDEVTAAATRLGIPSPPTLGHVEGVATRVAAARAAVDEAARLDREIDQLAGELAAEEAALAAADAAVDAAAQHVAAAAAAWEACKDVIGVGGGVGVGVDGDDPRVVTVRHDRVVTAARALDALDRRTAEADEARTRVVAFRATLHATLARTGHQPSDDVTHDVADVLDAVVAAAERHQRAGEERASAAAQLVALLGTGEAAADATRLLEQRDPIAWDGRARAIDERLAVVDDERDEHVRRHTRLAGHVDSLGGDDAVPRAAQQLAAAQTHVDVLAEDWVVADGAARLLGEAVGSFERDQHPRVLAAAGELLSAATLGAWTRLRQLDGRLVASRGNDDHPVAVDHLSRGTQEQLYLSLRLALADDRTRSDRRSLPLLVDDLLGATDRDRAGAVARLLAGVARRQQVWLFTCDPRTAALATATDPSAAVLELARGGRVVGWSSVGRRQHVRGPISPPVTQPPD